MRLLVSLLAALLVAPFAASAQTIKQVEVTKFPDPQNVAGAVEVTNRDTVKCCGRS